MIVDIPDELVKRLRKLARTEADFENDDFNVVDFCGSNVDDAYERGETQGEIIMAREIVALFPKD